MHLKKNTFLVEGSHFVYLSTAGISDFTYVIVMPTECLLAPDQISYCLSVECKHTLYMPVHSCAQ